jgi:hypothetical protein
LAQLLDHAARDVTALTIPVSAEEENVGAPGPTLLIRRETPILVIDVRTDREYLDSICRDAIVIDVVLGCPTARDGQPSSIADRPCLSKRESVNAPLSPSVEVSTNPLQAADRGVVVQQYRSAWRGATVAKEEGLAGHHDIGL